MCWDEDMNVFLEDIKKRIRVYKLENEGKLMQGNIEMIQKINRNINADSQTPSWQRWSR